LAVAADGVGGDHAHEREPRHELPAVAVAERDRLEGVGVQARDEFGDRFESIRRWCRRADLAASGASPSADRSGVRSFGLQCRRVAGSRERRDSRRLDLAHREW